jgi:hypothetical protein
MMAWGMTQENYFFLKICGIFTNAIICDITKKITIKIYQKIIHPGLDTIALGA